MTPNRRTVLFFLLPFCGWWGESKGQSLEEQKRQFLYKEISQNYTPPSPDIGDPEKYYWPIVMARMERFGQKDSLANSYIRKFSGNSPFHFTLVGMARIWYLYPQSPALQENRNRILSKVFDRSDSYNSWTAEGTENHINMSRTSGYLFAQAAIQLGFKTEMARIRLAEMKKWILDWSRSTLHHGTGEWNSGIYGPYNLMGWLNLADFAEDEEVREAARKVCTYYATEMALFYSWGVTGGPEMRGQGIEGNAGNASAYWGWFWFSEEPRFNPQLGKEYIQSVHAATSGFHPEPQLIELARKKMEKPIAFRIQMPDYTIRKPGFCQNTFWASRHFTLGSTSNEYGGWTGSTSQIVSWKLVSKPEKPGDVPIQVSGNGMYYAPDFGKGRDPFTQICQSENVLIQLTCLPRNLGEIEKQMDGLVRNWRTNWEKDFRIRFPHDRHKENVVKTRSTRIRKSGSELYLDVRGRQFLENGVLFVEYPGTYLAIRSIRQAYPVSKKNQPKNKGRKGHFPLPETVIDDCLPGEVCGFILEAGDFSTYKSFEAFKKAIQSTRLSKPGKGENTLSYVDARGRILEARFETSGKFEEALVDWGYGVKSQQIDIAAAPFRQPEWPTGPGHGKLATFQVNGQTKTPGSGIVESAFLEIKNGQIQFLSENRNP